jgi:dedicated sortase system histidine kinase
MKWRISLRVQLLSITLILFAIPYLGYKYIWEMESYLREGQENTMIGTAKAVATMLHEQPALLDANAAYRNQLRPGTDLYAPYLPGPIQLDGKFNDWQEVEYLLRDYGTSEVVVSEPTIYGNDETPTFSHMVGRYRNYLYARFDITDDTLLWRAENSIRVDRNDHLLIGLKDTQGAFQRYVISPRQSGWVNAYRLADDQGYDVADNALFIQGVWVATEKGVNIELRLPLSAMTRGLAFAYMDVDEEQTYQAIGVGTANPNEVDNLGSVVTPSPEIERILRSMLYTDSRVWVLDRYQRVLAKVGDIQSAQGLVARRNGRENSTWDTFEQKYLLPLYYRILTRPPNEFIDSLTNAVELQGDDIKTALAGKPDSMWRLSEDNKAVILSAAHPIFYENTVIGAVVVEQTTHGIRTLRNRALENLFHIILAVMLIATLGLVFLSQRTSNRIRALRDATEDVIDDSGKIIGELKPVKPYDEIGDLWSTFREVLSRLNQYNHYLESMASRLSHELRTPVAIVKSSLDTLNAIDDENSRQVVMERARTGIERLSKLLNSMSEATRLEQTLQREEKIEFDALDVVESCVQGYQQIYPLRRFEFKRSCSSALLKGSPDLFVQMLDKIIANATEFSNEGDAIVLHAWNESNTLKLSITNPGPLLPEVQHNQLLQSMVSMREPSEGTEDVHLGLGLYIANAIAHFHQGGLSLTNVPDHTGVCVILSFVTDKKSDK